MYAILTFSKVKTSSSNLIFGKILPNEIYMGIEFSTPSCNLTQPPLVVTDLPINNVVTVKGRQQIDCYTFGLDQLTVTVNNTYQPAYGRVSAPTLLDTPFIIFNQPAVARTNLTLDTEIISAIIYQTARASISMPCLSPTMFGINKDEVLAEKNNKRFLMYPDNLPKFHQEIDYELGPIEIGNTGNGLLYEPWVIWAENYGDQTTDAIKISKLSNKLTSYEVLRDYDVEFVTFTFDQLGRPTVAYTYKGLKGACKLYWYNSATSSQETLLFNDNIKTPYLTLDNKRIEYSGTSNMLLFYLKTTDLNIYLRKQSDRFAKEYTIGMLPSDKIERIEHAGMSTDYRATLIFKVNRALL